MIQQTKKAAKHSGKCYAPVVERTPSSMIVAENDPKVNSEFLPTKPYPREGLARISEAAAFLAVSRASLYRMMSAGQLPFRQLGRSRRVPWQNLHCFAETGTAA
jgi:excisionase family DNA binding protein